MKKRCNLCKCLEEESSVKYFKRIKTGTDTKFYCRKCQKQSNPKEQNSPSTRVKTDVAPKNTRKRYSVKKVQRSLIRKEKTYLQLSHEERCLKLSSEEGCAIGAFIRKKPLDCKVAYIVPIEKGGRYELSNLHYVNEFGKSEKKWTKKIKDVVSKLYPFTPMRREVAKIQVTSDVQNRVSKYKRLRTLTKIKAM